MLLIFLVFCVVLLCFVTFRVPCCDVRIQTMFGSSFPPVVCRMAHVLFTLFFFARVIGVQHILCCAYSLFVYILCFVYPELPVSLDCPF